MVYFSIVSKVCSNGIKFQGNFVGKSFKTNFYIGINEYKPEE